MNLTQLKISNFPKACNNVDEQDRWSEKFVYFSTWKLF